MKNLVIIMAITCASCSFDETIEYHVPPEIESYVDMFRQDAIKNTKYDGKMITSLNISYVKNLTKPEYGRCIAFTSHMGSMVIIELDEDYFKYYLSQNYEMRIKGIMYHELGHGFLHRSHTSKFSLMNPSWTEICDKPDDKNWPILIEELFQN